MTDVMRARHGEKIINLANLLTVNTRRTEYGAGGVPLFPISDVMIIFVCRWQCFLSDCRSVNAFNEAIRNTPRVVSYRK